LEVCRAIYSTWNHSQPLSSERMQWFRQTDDNHNDDNNNVDNDNNDDSDNKYKDNKDRDRSIT
jgi:hypothetical protein